MQPIEIKPVDCKKCGFNYCPCCETRCPKCGEVYTSRWRRGDVDLAKDERVYGVN